MINAAERLALRKQSNEVQQAPSTSHRPYSPAYSLFSTPATFAERLQVRASGVPCLPRPQAILSKASAHGFRLCRRDICEPKGYSVIGPLICVDVSGGGRGGWQGN
jgi:hypothetical protein